VPLTLAFLLAELMLILLVLLIIILIIFVTRYFYEGAKVEKIIKIH